MSDRKDLAITLPEWYQMELQTQKTMLRLSGVHELEFYLNHPDEYIRHQAILRLGQLRSREALAPLSKIIDDPLEMTINKEIAAWVLKSTGLIGNDDFYIGNQYLDRYTGNEKLRDFYYPGFTEGRTTPEYHFGSSGIEAMLREETLVIRAESLEEKVELPFSLNRWFKTWSKMKLEGLRKGSKEFGKKSAAAMSGFIHRLTHPEKKPVTEKKKQHRKKDQQQNQPTGIIFEQATNTGQLTQEIITPQVLTAAESITPQAETVNKQCHTAQEITAPKAEAEIAAMKLSSPVTEAKTVAVDIRKKSDNGLKPENRITVVELSSPDTEVRSVAEDIRKKSDIGLNPENRIPVETSRDIFTTSDKDKTEYYTKPFTLKTITREKEDKKLRVKSKIYVRGNSRELSFADAVKGITLKLLKIILLPFVILWNQKVVFLTLIVCLYLFFTFIPIGRMLFYRRSPELARINDKAVKAAQVWVTDKVDTLKEMASEYELVRDIQKRMVSGTQEQKTVQEPVPKPVRYIVTSKTLNMRKAPGTKSDKLLVLEQNMIVEYLNQSMDTDEGQTWLYIQAPDGTAGWSFAGYLKKLEDGIEAYEGK